MRYNSPKIYYETRQPSADPKVGIAVDIARHLQHRQFLGTAVVVCDNPVAILSAVRKQWVMAMRRVQTRRASTLRSQEVARLSQAATHMAGMRFGAHPPHDDPDCSVYFLKPSELHDPPSGCHTLYIASRFGAAAIAEFAANLPQDSLCVVYGDLYDAKASGWLPKEQLEAETASAWNALQQFMSDNNLMPQQLLDIRGKLTLRCLSKIARFKRQLSLTRPLMFATIDQQRRYEDLDQIAAGLQLNRLEMFHNYMSSNLDTQEAMDYFPFSTR